MSIAMDRYGTSEHPSHSRGMSEPQSPVYPYRVQCRRCGFEPEAGSDQPTRCPKCFGGAWERFTIPGSLLVNTDRRANNHSAWLARADAN